MVSSSGDSSLDLIRLMRFCFRKVSFETPTCSSSARCVRGSSRAVHSLRRLPLRFASSAFLVNRRRRRSIRFLLPSPIAERRRRSLPERPARRLRYRRSSLLPTPAAGCRSDRRLPSTRDRRSFHPPPEEVDLLLSTSPVSYFRQAS